MEKTTARAGEGRATLANWRNAPWSAWAFRNVRSLMPTAAAAPAQSPSPLQDAWRDIQDVSVSSAGETVRLREFLRANHVSGFVALHRGRLAFEHYDNGLTAHAPHILFSVSKSVTGALAGVLVEKGLLDPARPVVDYVPELAASAYADANVRHVLDMSIALAFSEDYADPHGVMPAYRRAAGWDPGGVVGEADLHGFLAGLKSDGGAHGQAFHYASPNTDVLGWIMERAAGRAWIDMLQEWIWEPIGAEGEAWVTLDAVGGARTAGGVCATTRDMARFGEMMRRGGLVNGRQVVPSWWIDDIRSGGDAGAWARGNFAAMGFPAEGYRSKWYLFDRNTGAFGGAGIHGQWLYVCPASEVTIATFSAHPVAADIPYSVGWIEACKQLAPRLVAG